MMYRNITGIVLFTFVLCLQMTDAQTNTDDVASLIEGLQAAKFEQRKKAAMELYEKGSSAVSALFQQLIDPNGSVEARQKCGQILLEMSKRGDDELKKTLKAELVKLDPNNHARVKSQLLKLRMELLGEVHYSFSEAVTRLAQAGCSVQDTRLGTHVNFSKWHGTLKDFQCILAFKKPINLSITTDLSLEHYQILKKLNIHSISLVRNRNKNRTADSGLDEKKIDAIAECRSIQILRFNIYSPVKKEILQSLGKLTELKILTLPRGTTDETIRGLSKLKKLERLSFRTMCYIQGDGFEALTKLPSLQHLDLNQCKFEPEFFKHLAELPALTHLSLPQTTTTNDSSIKLVARIKTLQSLEFDNTCVTDAGVSELKNLRQLKSIQFSEAAITDRSIDVLNELPNLSRVSFHQTFVSPKGFERLECDHKNADRDQLYKPKNEEEYLRIQKLLDAGFVVRPSGSDGLRIMILDEVKNEKSEIVQELRHLDVRLITIDTSMSDDFIKALKTLDSAIPITFGTFKVSDANAESIREHFVNVNDYRQANLERRKSK